MAIPYLEWVKVLGPLLFSWPVAIVLLAVVFRDLIRKLANRLIDSTDAKAEFGPLKVQLGSIAKDSQDVLARLHLFLELSARHKLFANELLVGQLSHRFTPEQIQQLSEQSEQIKTLLAQPKA